MKRVIAVKNPGQLWPDAWIEAALKEHPSCSGFAAVTDSVDEAGTATGKEMSTLHNITDKDHPAFTLAAVQDLQNNFKDETVIGSFGRSSTVVSLEDAQPFVLLQNDDETPALVAFVAGEYPGFAQTGSTLSPEYHLTQKYLIPKIGQLARLCDGDIDKLMQELLDPVFKGEIETKWATRGTVLFLSDTDKYLAFELNDLKRDYPWGRVSDHCGFDVPKEGSFPERTITAGKNLAKSLQRAVSGPVSQVPAAQVVGKLAPPPQPDTAIPEKEYWTPPANLFGKPLKSLIRSKHRELYGSNDLPEGYNKPGFRMEIPKGKGAIKALSDLPAVAGNTTLAKEIKAAAPVATQVTDKPQPILSPQIVEALQEDFLTRFDHTKKVVDANNALILDPDIMSAMENQLPPVWKQVGMDLESLFSAKYPDFEDIGRKYPDFMSMLAFNMIGLLMRSYKTVEPVKPSAPASGTNVPSVPAALRKKTLSLPPAAKTA